MVFPEQIAMLAGDLRTQLKNVFFIAWQEGQDSVGLNTGFDCSFPARPAGCCLLGGANTPMEIAQSSFSLGSPFRAQSERIDGFKGT